VLEHHVCIILDCIGRPIEGGIMRSRTCATGKGFTLIELLVVIAIIALLMSILMPALNRVKLQARAVACRANLKQWSTFFMLYTQDYNGKFQAGIGTANSPGHSNHWFSALRPYYHNDKKIMCCPTATKPLDADSDGVADGRFNVFSAWGVFNAADDVGYDPDGDWGSYGINGWVEDPPVASTTVYESFATANNWRTPNVKGAGYVPLIMDALRFNVFPLEMDTPPETEDMAWESTQHMRRICIDRHNGYTNMAFLDWSVRNVGIKELWTLRWHKAYSTSGPWTTAGGVMPTDWPEWMRKFKNY
jgi:prepilin-type N-terminal cleavage/methylation domain-containing protein/prepilin-type processing-associated H-X9-DG protein